MAKIIDIKTKTVLADLPSKKTTVRTKILPCDKGELKEKIYVITKILIPYSY